MAIPITYNIRNLAVRKTTTVMTALGIALTVAVLLAAFSLVEGLKTAFEGSGHPLNVLVTRKGSDSELSSNYQRSVFNDMKFKQGIAKDKKGDPLASLEMVTVITLASEEFPEGTNVNVRGVTPTGLEIREDSKIIEGRWFTPGRREVTVGSSVAKRYPAAHLGGKLKFGRGEWEVVGVFDTPQMARKSEILTDLNQAAGDFERTEVLSSALIRATDEVARQALVNDLSYDSKLNVQAKTEKEYYAMQTSSGDLVKYLGTFVAFIMAVGSCFAAMNTMYAAVARRSKEIGTLRILGFSRVAIMTSFLAESLMLATLGGLLGILLVLPLNGISTGIGSNVTFSEVAFQLRVSPQIMVRGLVFALFMGAFGGLLPAFSAARKQILVALRQI
ncbi:ABC transporter permease [uncultured Paludibaculum sp.]|uniref:ABC transporter permease n=1 Tax=uncultured Paludibaculum sp. TaxID=1765020 RepID=UPI002AAC0840|nr:ABC transporter permease [uncultured Paludibaculum sp.]